MKKIYVCEEDMTAVFSALYDAWKECRDKEAEIEFRGMLEQRLFCEYIEVKTQQRKAESVKRLIQKHLGYTAYWDIFYALLSGYSDRADAVFHVMQAARTVKNSRKIMEHLSTPAVARVFELRRRVSNEAHLFKEFIRFRELKNGVLFSEVTPRSKILVCVGDHFADRFPLENWMIYDKTHQEFLVHRANCAWVLVEGEELNREEARKVSEAQAEFEGLWKCFFQSVSIKERENPVCQRNHLPLHFRVDMTEFN